MTRNGDAMETYGHSIENPLNSRKETSENGQTSKFDDRTSKPPEKVKSTGRVSFFNVFTCSNSKAVCRRFPVAFTALIVLPILGLIVLGICYGLGTPRCTNILAAKYSYPLNYDRTLPLATNNNETYNIVLFGDSLIRFGMDEMGLAEKMQAYLPDFKLKIANYGVDSDVIQRMHDRVDDMLSATKCVLCNISPCLLRFLQDLTPKSSCGVKLNLEGHSLLFCIGTAMSAMLRNLS